MVYFINEINKNTMKKTILTALVMIMSLISGAQTMEWHNLSKVLDNDTLELRDSVVVNYISMNISHDTAFVSYYIIDYEPIIGQDDFGFPRIAGYKKKAECRVTDRKFKVIHNDEKLISTIRMTKNVKEEVRVFNNWNDRNAVSVFVLCGEKYLKCGAFKF